MAAVQICPDPINIRQIKNNLEIVYENISQAAIRSGRKPDEVKLVVVTKTHPVETVQMVIEAGAQHIGENYIEEARDKLAMIDNPDNCFWHMIGHVQSRKSSQVVEYFDYLHSLDSLKLAQRLDTQANSKGVKLPVMFEFNVSGEESKSGWQAVDEDNWKELLPVIESVVSLGNLQVRGLMTMPPYTIQPEEARQYYQKLSRLQIYLRNHIPVIDWNELSMGMSGDYQVAVEEGATWVRIGQAILGARRT